MDIFVHIPKSSGSTIRTILSREYGVRNIFFFEQKSGEWKKFASSPVEFLRNGIQDGQIRLITGHQPFGVHSLINIPCRYFSMIRDPVDRALSDYYYAYPYETHRFRDKILSGRVSVEEYLENDVYCSACEQIDMLAGYWTGLRGRTDAAMGNVRRSFVAVGMAERFDESILLIAKGMGWHPPLYVRRNVTKLDEKNAAKRAEWRTRARDRYAERFGDEYRLFKAVDEHLSLLIEREGPKYQRAFEAFQELQRQIETHADASVFDRYEMYEDDKLPEYVEPLVESDSYRIIQDYFQTPSPILAATRNYIGNIDNITTDTIAGWAADLSTSGPIKVTAWRGPQMVDSTLCNGFRKDLIGYGLSGDNMGFRFDLKEPILNTADVSVCFEDSVICLPLPGAPRATDDA